MADQPTHRKFADDRAALLRITEALIRGRIPIAEMGPKNRGDLSWHFRLACEAHAVLRALDRVYDTREPEKQTEPKEQTAGGAW